MLDKLMKLSIVLHAVDQLSGPLKDAVRAIEAVDHAAGSSSAKLRELGGSIEDFGKKALVASAAATALVAVPVKAFADAEEQLNQAKLSFLNKDGLDKGFGAIEESAVSLGHQLNTNDKQLDLLAASLHRAGMSTQALQGDGFKAAAQFHALFSDIPVDQLGETLGGLRKQLHLTEGDFGPLLDLIQRVSFGFGLDAADLQETLKKIAPITTTLGVSGIEGTKSLMSLAGAMYQTGIRGRQLSGGLTSVMEMLPGLDQRIKKSAEIQELLGQKGIALNFFDTQGKFLGMENFVKQIEKLNALSSSNRLSVLTEAFGPQSAGLLATLGQGGVAGFQQAVAVIDQQASATDRLKLKLGGAKDQGHGLWETVGQLTEALGAPFTKVLQDVGLKLKPIVEWLTTWVEKHPKLVGVVFGSIAVFAGFAAALGAVSFAIGAIVSAVPSMQVGLVVIKGLAKLASLGVRGLADVLWTGATAMWGFTASLLANPITWAVVGVAALAASLYGLYKRFGLVKTAAVALFAPFLVPLAGAMLLIQKLTGFDLFAAGKKIMTTLWDGMTAFAHKPIEAIRKVVQRIRDFLPFSPAKEGPLTDLHRVRITETIAATMRAAPMISAMRVAALGTMTVAAAAAAPGRSLGSGSGASSTPVHITYAPVIHLAPGTSAEVQGQLLSTLDQDKKALVQAVLDALASRGRGSFG